jgi:DNA-binding transcriptional regulator YiaG
MKRHTENVRYDKELGLSGVTLLGVNVNVCAQCGEREIEIRNMEGLLRALALAIVRHPWRPTGEEIRYLRKYLGHSGVDFARRMGVDPSTVSRWEAGTVDMGAQAQRALRLMVVHGRPAEEYPLEELEKVSQEHRAHRYSAKLSRGGEWSADLAS